MLNLLFRALLTFNATSLLLVVFAVQKGYRIFDLVPGKLGRFLEGVPDFVCHSLYMLVPIILTGISIYLSKRLGSDKFEKESIVRIEYANNSFLPSYLGYFFVALSVQNLSTLAFVYVVLFVFTMRSQALYFNPLFLLFGYEFYNAETKSGTVLFLISKSEYKSPESVGDMSANRINNYTFIERGE